MGVTLVNKGCSKHKTCKMNEQINRTVEYSELAERNFYMNQVTGESYWSMPAEVKFYIPPKLENKVHTSFHFCTQHIWGFVHSVFVISIANNLFVIRYFLVVTRV